MRPVGGYLFLIRIGYLDRGLDTPIRGPTSTENPHEIEC
jgi:hypothetical protein